MSDMFQPGSPGFPQKNQPFFFKLIPHGLGVTIPDSVSRRYEKIGPVPIARLVLPNSMNRFLQPWEIFLQS
jgi:hypothetical protein